MGQWLYLWRAHWFSQLISIQSDWYITVVTYSSSPSPSSSSSSPPPPPLLLFFFFFHWHYNPLWALACRTMSFHFLLSATNYLHLLPALEDFFLLPLSIFSWVFPFFLSLPVLGWISFWASYPPPFSLGDLTSLSFALLSISLYFLLCSSLLVLDSSDFSIPRFHI